MKTSRASLYLFKQSTVLQLLNVWEPKWWPLSQIALGAHFSCQLMLFLQLIVARHRFSELPRGQISSTILFFQFILQLLCRKHRSLWLGITFSSCNEWINECIHGLLWGCMVIFKSITILGWDISLRTMQTYICRLPFSRSRPTVPMFVSVKSTQYC